jgi:DNA-3-methyladenine glycosylase II
MKRVIGAVGPCTLTPNPADPFTLLVRCVVSQQISTKAAASIFGKLSAAVGGPPILMPKLARMSEAKVRECGLSGAKYRTIRAVMDHVKANPDLLPGIEERANETIHEQLTAIKGIGPWTAEMFLIFAIGKPDVLSVSDYGIKAAMRNLFGLKEMPKPQEMHTLAEPWKPYRSIASWYLWRSLELPKAK